MNKFSKILSYVAKFVLAIFITALTTALLDFQGQKRLLYAERSYDSLNSSIMEMLPSAAKAHNAFLTDTETNNDDIEKIKDLEEFIETKTKIDSEKESANEKIITAFAYSNSENSKSVNKSSSINNTDRNRILNRKVIVSDQLGELYSKPVKIKTPEINTRSISIPSEFAFKIKEKHSILINSLGATNYKLDERTIKNIISASISIAINNIDLDEKDMLALKKGMADIEKNVGFLGMDLQEIRNISTKVKLLQNLEQKANRIGMELGAEFECNFHKPEFDINENLEIKGMKQTYECHPEIAEKVMKRIKLLPEWRKLTSRNR